MGLYVHLGCAGFAIEMVAFVSVKNLFG